MMTAYKLRHWQVKALEEELRDSTIQIQEAKTQIAVLHSQVISLLRSQQNSRVFTCPCIQYVLIGDENNWVKQRQTQSAQITREPAAERESLAQFKKEV